MPRKKIKHTLILRKSSRKATLEKRMASLLKAAKELSILCDIDIGIVIFNPEENKSIVWPSPQAVTDRFTRFLSIPKTEQMKKMVGHEQYLMDRVQAENERLRIKEKANVTEEMKIALNQLIKGRALNELDFDVKQMNNLYSFVTEKLKRLKERNKELITDHSLFPRPPYQSAKQEKTGASSSALDAGSCVSPLLEDTTEDPLLVEAMPENQENSNIAGQSDGESAPKELDDSNKAQKNGELADDFTQTLLDMFYS